jgi:syntaxin 1B/2/3
MIMSNQDFLARVEGVKSEIRQLTGNVSEIGSIHQRVLSSPDSGSSSQLEALVAQTQILNTRIKDQIKQLETDAAKSGKNQTKDSQVRTLKSNFKSQLEEYQREEQTYRTRYREQIARQYRIVNPEASDMEVREAADADWGNEGVFQTAVSYADITRMCGVLVLMSTAEIKPHWCCD